MQESKEIHKSDGDVPYWDLKKMEDGTFVFELSFSNLGTSENYRDNSKKETPEDYIVIKGITFGRFRDYDKYREHYQIPTEKSDIDWFKAIIRVPDDRKDFYLNAFLFAKMSAAELVEWDRFLVSRGFSYDALNYIKACHLSHPDCKILSRRYIIGQGPYIDALSKINDKEYYCWIGS